MTTTTTRINPLATVPAADRLQVSLTWLAAFANEIERHGKVEFVSDLARDRALVFIREAASAPEQLNRLKLQNEQQQTEIRDLKGQLARSSQALSMRSPAAPARSAPAPAEPSPIAVRAPRLAQLSQTLTDIPTDLSSKEPDETHPRIPEEPQQRADHPQHPAGGADARPAVDRHPEPGPALDDDPSWWD